MNRSKKAINNDLFSDHGGNQIPSWSIHLIAIEKQINEYHECVSKTIAIGILSQLFQAITLLERVRKNEEAIKKRLSSYSNLRTNDPQPCR